MGHPARVSAIIEGPLLPAVLRLAWPVIVAEGLYTAFHAVDLAWVGRLGAAATAAATTSMFAAWIIFSLSSLVTTGITAHVARAVGGGREREAREAAAQAFHMALILGAASALLGWIGAPYLFALVGAPPDVAAAGTIYLRIMALGAPATLLYMGGAAVMRAAGNTRAPMIVVGLSVIANAALGPALIYGVGGVGGFHGLGIAGAPIATLICQAGSVAAFVRLAHYHPDFPFALEAVGKPNWRLMASLGKIGAPYFATVSSFAVVYLYFSRLASAWGAAAIAVVGVSNRLESICFLPADGFAAASATLVGQSLGAGLPARAARGAWSAVGITACFAAVLSSLYLIAPQVMLSLFSGDPGVLAAGTPYLRVIALCTIATGVETVVSGGFAGSGDTVPVLVAYVGVSILRLPLAWLCAVHFGLGLMGIAWTISLTCIARAAGLALWFRRGAWQRHRVAQAEPRRATA